MMHTVPPRSAITPADTWDAASVFPSDVAWEAELQRITASLAELERWHGQLGTSPTRLLAWLATSEELQKQAGKVLLYARMFHNVDTTDQAAAAKNDQASSFYAQVMTALAFAEPELLAIGFTTLNAWLAAEPGLAAYRHYFARLAQRQAHVRSPEVEELLSQLADPFGSAKRIHGTLTDADLHFAAAQAGTGETIDVLQGNLPALLTNADRAVRRSAWESYADAHLQVKHAVANCLATGVKQDVFMARARRYSSSLEAALTPNYIPVDVFHRLIAAFKQHLPTWHRYWNVRRRALGYSSLHPYDIKAPLTRHKPHVPFAQAVDWISTGLQPLGAEYVAALRHGVLRERWVDKYPNQGKRSGAFSTGLQGTHPFIMLSYNDDLFSMSTLAHELGHSLHSYHTWQAQPPQYADYGLFVAETASNFNQALVRAHLLASNPARDLEIAVLEEAMSNFHRYFFIMPTLARFELEIHERVERGAGLTADSLIELMAGLFSEGYGDEVVVDVPRVGITWAEFATHLYANFYVYQYATGISAAHTLAERVFKGEAGAADQYLQFLRAGSSLYPLDALRLAGVDMLSPEPVEATFGVLARMVDRLAELLDQPVASAA